MKKMKLNSASKLFVPVTAFAIIAGMACSTSTVMTVNASSSVPVVTTEDATELEYRVKFINYDGSELYNELQTYGSNIVTPVVPDRIGFTFIGWAPEVDATVPAQDMVYTAQYQQAETSTAVSPSTSSTSTSSTSTSSDSGSVVVYDSEAEASKVSTGSDLSAGCEENHFVHFIFMLIVFLMETAWLHDRRTQQMKRYDAIMDKVDRE